MVILPQSIPLDPAFRVSANTGYAGRPQGTGRPCRRQGRIPDDHQHDREFLLWLAGFIDGEGSIFITARKQGREAVVMLNIANSDQAVLEWIQESVGFGYVYNGGEERPRRKPRWFYNVSGYNAVHLLKELAPLLRIKRKQTEMAITAQSGPLEERLLIRDELRRLNVGGARVPEMPK